MKSDHLFAFIGFNITAFVLLITFYLSFIKNLYDTFLQHLSYIEDNSKKQKVYDRITNYFYTSDFLSGTTAIYVIFVIAMSVLFLAQSNEYQFQFFIHISNRRMAFLILSVYIAAIVGVFVLIRKHRRNWKFVHSRWFYFAMAIYTAIFLMLGVQIQSSFATPEDYHSFLLVMLSLFVIHLTSLVVVQFMGFPLTTWKESINWEKLGITEVTSEEISEGGGRLTVWKGAINWWKKKIKKG